MTLNVLEIAKHWGEQRQPLKRVYRKLCDRELFLAAYGKLYANQGATTAGIEPADTVDGMSMTRIEQILEQLKTGTYQWQPVRREYIQKKHGGQRPLGIPGWRDKLVQEVIRMLLEAYYEPRFSPYSHGFRPGRGCHTALIEIHNRWKGVKWFIEGDIEGCYDNIDHTLILDILGRDMPDPKFLKLIKEMLAAGYVEDWQYQRSYSGVPQGGVVSPVLSNIVLNEFDQYIETELIPNYTQGKRRKKNPAYTTILEQKAQAQAANAVDDYKTLSQQLRQIPSVVTDDPAYRRLYYCRYADDFILGFAGPYQEALEIKAAISDFLHRMKLTLSAEKTLITHAATQRANFLGYELSARRSNTKLTQDQHTTRKRRTTNSTVQLHVPHQVAKAWENQYQRKGKPTHRPELEHHSDYEIVMAYNVELQGMVNYYLLAVDVAKRLYPVRYAYLQSLVKTLAHKHKQKATWVYRKYKAKFETGMTGLEVVIPREEPKKPLVARFGATPIRRNKTVVIKDAIPAANYSRNELIRRFLANECELCGAKENIEVHHIRKLADLKQRYKGQREPPVWVIFMLARNRKTIVVCRNCHQAISYGRYDGRKLA
jgi:group II intron reverse transcriptase/maturase